MMELSDLSFGPFHLYTIETGRFRLDGGAMFGVVPKPLWSRKIDVDDKNSDRVYLIDNGCGTKFDDKFESIYQLDHEHSSLLRSLEYHGFKTEDVTDVIFTHLHFDHCGGTTYYDDDGELKHRFPNARYHVTEKQLNTALHPNAREKASFLPDNIKPIAEWDKLQQVPERHTYEKGLEAIPVNGHTTSQQLPKVTAEGKTIAFMADLLPTHVHLPLPWVMGYDMYPVKTLNEKEQILNQAIAEDWYLYMEHDAEEELITAKKEGGKYAVQDRLNLNEVP